MFSICPLTVALKGKEEALASCPLVPACAATLLPHINPIAGSLENRQGRKKDGGKERKLWGEEEESNANNIAGGLTEHMPYMCMALEKNIAQDLAQPGANPVLSQQVSKTHLRP